VDECGDLGTERETAYDCQLQCEDQHDLYWKTWTDPDKRDAFRAELTCLNGSTCDEIAAGACYDPEVWSF
jgi:hypothetical protein